MSPDIEGLEGRQVVQTKNLSLPIGARGRGLLLSALLLATGPACGDQVISAKQFVKQLLGRDKLAVEIVVPQPSYVPTPVRIEDGVPVFDEKWQAEGEVSQYRKEYWFLHKGLVIIQIEMF